MSESDHGVGVDDVNSGFRLCEVEGERVFPFPSPWNPRSPLLSSSSYVDITGVVNKPTCLTPQFRVLPFESSTSKRDRDGVTCFHMDVTVLSPDDKVIEFVGISLILTDLQAPKYL